jgi:hypothetical protein
MIAALWIGDAERPEFAAAAAALQQHARIYLAATVEDALRIGAAADCDVAIVAESLPLEHGRAVYDVLRRRRPTLPIVRLTGPGCDGETRSHTVEPVFGIRWFDAPAVLKEACGALERGECPNWGRPITAGPEERLLDAVAAERPSAEFAGNRLGIIARDPAIAAWLAALARAEGGRLADRTFAGPCPRPTRSMR